ncbi:MAG TPA: arginase family protein [Acidimicrobiia bacterium]|nr:arginase family protein [Acidimicrobiia bacterium]
MPIVDQLWPRADVWLAQENPDPDVLVVGVPSSKASLSPSRADLTPLEVRDRLHRFSTFHGEAGIDLAGVTVRDMGNWPVSELAPDALISELTSLAENLPESSLKLYLGGDNAITRPLVAAESEDLTSVGLITFDAHHDVRTLANGPNNGSPVRGLIEDHGLPGRNVVQIGIHSFANSKAYRTYCDEVGITTVTVEHVERIGMKTAVELALIQLGAICEKIYVDVDIDVLDTAFAPACPGARPGGLTVRQLSEGVLRCGTDPSVSAMDFVEVDASRDVAGQTLDVMAHLLLTAVSGFAMREATEA